MNLWWAYALFDEDSLCANMKLSMAIIYVAGKFYSIKRLLTATNLSPLPLINVALPPKFP